MGRKFPYDDTGRLVLEVLIARIQVLFTGICIHILVVYSFFVELVERVQVLFTAVCINIFVGYSICVELVATQKWLKLCSYELLSFDILLYRSLVPANA